MKIFSSLLPDIRTLRFIGLLLVGFFLLGELSFADTTTSSTASTPTDETDMGKFLKSIFNILARILSAVLGALTAMVALFLTPGWVNGELFNLGNILREIWIMVSNVVYLIFAFLLIVIAFMNIVGKGEGTWELKQALPKFIVGVLIVPFSWFFVQLIVSLSSVLTVSALTLPFDTFSQVNTSADTFSLGAPKKEGKEEEYCVKQVLYLGKNKGDSEGSKNKNDKMFECKQKMTLTQIIASFNSSESVYGLINLYTYGVMRLDKLDTTTLEELTLEGGIKDILDLGVLAIFDLVFVLIYTVLMAALFVALFVRGILLWLYMMFAPVFGLSYFLGKDIAGEKFSIKEFIGLAMVPVYVAAALSFGLLFLFMAGQNEAFKNAGQEGAISMGVFSLEIKGGGSIADNTASEIGQLLIKMFGLVILWMGVMAALKQNQITAQVVAPIEQFGTQVGTLVGKSPMYLPIVPGSNGNTSLAALGQVGRKTMSSLEARPVTEAGDIISGNKFLRELNGVTNEISNAIGKHNAALNGPLSPAYVSALSDVTHTASSLNELAASRDYVSEFNKAVGKATADGAKDLDEISYGMSEGKMNEALLKLDKYLETKYTTTDGVLKGKTNWSHSNSTQDTNALLSGASVGSSSATTASNVNINLQANLTAATPTILGKTVTLDGAGQVSSLGDAAKDVASLIVTNKLNKDQYTKLADDNELSVSVKEEIAKHIKKDTSGKFIFDEGNGNVTLDDFLNSNK